MLAQALAETVDEWVRLGLGGNPSDARKNTPRRLGARRTWHDRRGESDKKRASVECHASRMVVDEVMENPSIRLQSAQRDPPIGGRQRALDPLPGCRASLECRRP